MAKLNEMVKEFRLSINQSAEALAMMLQITLEEYESLETDWVPPDEVLQQMCTLFEWNYQDIKRMALNTSSPATIRQNHPEPMTREPSSFHHLLQAARAEAGQSPEVIAMLLNIAPEYYQSFENTTIPPDDLVRKICSLFQWNYRDIRQQLINHATPRVTVGPPPLSLKEMQAHLPKKEMPSLPLEDNDPETLARRLYQARMEHQQTPSGISLLLDISEDYYLKLESGTIPEPELLKRIAGLFQWNYNELRLLLQNENIHQFQPRVTEIQSSSGLPLSQVQMLLEEIQQCWKGMEPEKQALLLVQLEVIRDTAKRWQLS